MNKVLYKLEIYLLKILPFILAIACWLNTCLCALDITIPIFVELATISFIPLLFLYISSYAFKFCEYHRIPLHYVTINKIISYIDYHFILNVSDFNFILVNTIIFGIFIIMYVIFKLLNK